MIDDKWTKKTMWKVIRNKCIDCGDGTFKEVERCPVKSCPLYEYRFGMPLDKWKQRKNTRKVNL